MPKGPKGERRPADINQRAFTVIRIATGETTDEPSAVPKRARGGRIGGKKRAERLSAEKRREIAEKAAAARWKQGNRSK